MYRKSSTFQSHLNAGTQISTHDFISWPLDWTYYMFLDSKLVIYVQSYDRDFLYNILEIIQIP